MRAMRAQPERKAMTVLLPKRASAKRCGINERSVVRYAEDERYSHLNFPKPTIINGRRFWVEAEIEAWVQARIAERGGKAA
jgi:predicted DNA-binding transcriptional regulator AlpA